MQSASLDICINRRLEEALRGGIVWKVVIFLFELCQGRFLIREAASVLGDLGIFLLLGLESEDE